MSEILTAFLPRVCSKLGSSDVVKSLGRPSSANVEDRRAYFGSNSVDPDYYYEDRNADFLRESLLSPYLSASPQQFSKTGLTMEELLNLLTAQKASRIGETTFTAGVL